MITQQQVSDVNMLLRNYKNLLDVHKWIRGLKEKGEEVFPHNTSPALFLSLSLSHSEELIPCKGRILTDICS